MALIPITTGLVIVSPVGYNAQPTCAVLRAGITPFTELKDIVDRQQEPLVIRRSKRLSA